jgi:nitrate/nitrite transporter NarK
VREIQEEIREAGMDFSQYARDYFGPGPVGVALGIAGSVGNLLVGNLQGAALSLAQSLNSARVQDAGPSAYSYLFQARRRLW